MGGSFISAPLLTPRTIAQGQSARVAASANAADSRSTNAARVDSAADRLACGVVSSDRTDVMTAVRSLGAVTRPAKLGCHSRPSAPIRRSITQAEPAGCAASRAPATPARMTGFRGPVPSSSARRASQRVIASTPGPQQLSSQLAANPARASACRSNSKGQTTTAGVGAVFGATDQAA